MITKQLIAFAQFNWSRSSPTGVLSIVQQEGCSCAVDNTSGTGGVAGEIIIVPDLAGLNLPLNPSSNLGQIGPSPSPMLQCNITLLGLTDSFDAVLDYVSSTYVVLATPPATVSPGTLVLPINPATGAPIAATGTPVLRIRNFGQVKAAPVGMVAGKFDVAVEVNYITGSGNPPQSVFF